MTELQEVNWQLSFKLFNSVPETSLELTPTMSKNTVCGLWVTHGSICFRAISLLKVKLLKQFV